MEAIMPQVSIAAQQVLAGNSVFQMVLPCKLRQSFRRCHGGERDVRNQRPTGFLTTGAASARNSTAGRGSITAAKRSQIDRVYAP